MSCCWVLAWHMDSGIWHEDDMTIWHDTMTRWQWYNIMTFIGGPCSPHTTFDTRTTFLAYFEAELVPKLEFHFLKSFFTSYSLSTQFLTFRSIWGFCKWSKIIPYSPKHWFCHQNHVSSMLRSWVTPQVRILDFLQLLYPVLSLQGDLRLLIMVPNDSQYPKTLVLPPEACLPCL